MRLLILGTGGMANHHAEHFAKIDGVEIVGGVDVSKERADAFCDKHNIKHRFTSLDEAIAWGIGGPSRDPLKFGIFFFDYDLDGRSDLLTVNGHLEEEIGKIQNGQRYQQPAQLFWNSGDAGFTAVQAAQAGPDLFRPLVGRGSAYADVDGDGDLDVVFTQVGGAPLLLRNDQALGHHYARLKLVGTTSNRDAVGARVKLTAGGQSQWRDVTPTRSYLSASELPVTFGLGTIGRVDEVEITWPGGKQQKLTELPVDRLTVVEEPK